MGLNKLMLFFVFIFVNNFAFGKNIDIDVSTKMIDTESKLALEMSVKNIGDKPIQIYRSDLPWGNESSTLIMVIKPNRQGTIMTRAGMIDDPALDVITIEPGQKIIGQINIDYLYPSLASERSKSDYLLFWSYQAKDLADDFSVRNGGMYVLPAQKNRK